MKLTASHEDHKPRETHEILSEEKLLEIPKEDDEIRIEEENKTDLKEEDSTGHLPAMETKLNERDEPILIPNTSIPEVDEDWGNKLWETIKQTQNVEKGDVENPPLKEIDFDKKTLELENGQNTGMRVQKTPRVARLKPSKPYHLITKQSLKSERYHHKNSHHRQC